MRRDYMHTRFIFFLMSLLYSFSLVAQKDTIRIIQDSAEKLPTKFKKDSTLNVAYLDTLFSKRAFKDIIDILSEKHAKDTLNFEEYILLSRSYGRTKKYVTGYVLTEEMIKKAQEQNDTLNLLEALNLKAEHMIDLNQIEKGSRYCDSITPFFRKKDSVLFMRLCFKCGLFYRYEGRLEKAYETYKKITLEKYRKLTLFKNNFGIILIDLKKYDEAVELISESLEIAKKRNDIYADLNIYYNNIASIYLKKRDFKNAKIYLDSAYASLKDGSRKASEITILDNYYDLYREQGNIEEAYDYLNKMFLLNESILKDRYEEKIQMIEAANKREGLLVKRVKYVRDELSDTKKNILRGTLFLLSLIFVLILLFFFFKNRSIQASYEKVLVNQKLGQVKLNPDNISHSLKVMQNMIDSKDKKTVVFISRFSKLLRAVLESSRKILIPLTEEKNILQYYLKVQELEQTSKFTFQITIDEESEFLEPQIPPMLLQKYLEHSIQRIDEVKEGVLNLKIDFIFENDQLYSVFTSNLKREETFHKLLEEEMEKSKKVLEVFSKKTSVSSDISVSYVDEEENQQTNIKIKIPYKIN